MTTSEEWSGPIAEIAAERRRQVEGEGWSVEHDDQHDDGSLALAAGCYALHAGGRLDFKAHPDPDPDGRSWRLIPRGWPISWAWKWWKPKDPRRDLIRAAALIVAEIERLDRAAARERDAHG